MSENLSDSLKGLQTIKPAGMWDAGGSDNEDRKDISGRRQVKFKKTEQGQSILGRGSCGCTALDQTPKPLLADLELEHRALGDVLEVRPCSWPGTNHIGPSKGSKEAGFSANSEI